MALLLTLGLIGMFAAIIGFVVFTIGITDDESGLILGGGIAFVLGVMAGIGGFAGANKEQDRKDVQKINGCLASGKQVIYDGASVTCFPINELTEQAMKIKVCLDKNGIPVHIEHTHNGVKCLVDG